MVKALSLITVLFALVVAAPAFASGTDVIAGTPAVKAVTSHSHTVISFKGKHGRQLYRAIAGREINLNCQPAQQGPQGPISNGDTDDFVAPKRARKLSATLEGDWCEVLVVRHHKTLKPIVAVAITPAGSAFLDERLYAVNLDGFVAAAGFDYADGRYPTTQQFVSHTKGALIALANPTDPVPPGRYGFYSDGAQHIEVVGVSAGGKRLFEDVNGDTVSTNVLGYLSSLDF